MNVNSQLEEIVVSILRYIFLLLRHTTNKEGKYNYERIQIDNPLAIVLQF